MRAREIMSSGAECVGEDQTLEEAARKLADLGVGSLPICGNDDRLKGMLTDRDIVIKAVAKGKDVATTLVRSLAEGKPVTIGADDSVDDAVKTMSKNEVRRLPVIDGHRLVGIISQADIARHLKPKQAGKLLQAVSESASPSRAFRLSRMLVLVAPIAGVAAVLVRRAGGAPGTIDSSTEVNVPVRTAYDQWTQFEEFPKFMGGVSEVRQLDDTRLHWVADIGGKRTEWDAKIVEQVPDSRVAWKSVDGRPNGGVVTFHRLDENRTQVKVHMDYQPQGIVEKVGSALGLDKGRVKVDLQRFKELIEAQGAQTGSWRGSVQDGSTAVDGAPTTGANTH